MNPLGVITGLAEEARCLDEFPQGERPRVGVGGARTVRARTLADELIAAGCRGLLSFGIAGDDAVVAGPAAKRALAAETGALIVDMESHAVAEAALEAGVPFAVVRAVSDPASRALPAWVPRTIGEDGRTRMGAVAAGILGHPLDLADLIGLWGENRRAFGALRRVASRVGPAFCLE